MHSLVSQTLDMAQNDIMPNHLDFKMQTKRPAYLDDSFIAIMCI